MAAFGQPATCIRRLFFLGIALSFGGCVLAPKEAAVERREMERAGKAYAREFPERALPEVPAAADVDSLVRRALLANGELETAYYEWAAAVHRVQQAGGYPNTPLATSFSFALNGSGSALDRTSVTIGPDPMENLAFPAKVYQAAKVALDDARAARRRYEARAFDIRRRVINQWNTYALQEERVRIQRENVRLLKLLWDTAAARVQAGRQQSDLIRAETAYHLGQNERANLEAMLPQQRAQLNAMLGRPPDAALDPPEQLPAPRTLQSDDAALLAIAAKKNPQLAVLASQLQGRADAVELARLQFIPDFNPFLGVTSSAAQAIGLGISIPTFLPELRGRVEEARAELNGMLAMYRQTKFDTAAGVVAALVTLRNSERQAALYDQQIVPAAERLLDLSQQEYASGTATLADLVDAQRTLLVAREGFAEARAGRESTLADLEALLGTDLELLHREPTTQAAHAGAETHAAMQQWQQEE